MDKFNHQMVKRTLSLLIVSLCIVTASALADVKLPNVIGSNMVLQRDKPIPIWGWAGPDEEIKVEFAGQKVGTKADEKGVWMVRLPDMEAGGPYQMTVSGENTIELTNILVGEVWVCSGQSNMRMGLGLVNNSSQEIAKANYPNIRLFDVPLKTAGSPQQDIESEWKVCSSENVSTDNIWEGWPKGFSAVAYFFGREIHNKLNVPVGLIQSSWGGTRIEPWTPPEGFKLVPELKEMSEKIDKANQDYEKATEEAVAEYEKWLPPAKDAVEVGESILSPPTWPKHELDSHRQPAGLYNAMIHPLVPFAIRGAIWYQGEANLDDGMMYYDKMKAMIGGWRRVWEQGDFPFYFVQIAPFRYRWGSPRPYRLPKLWEAQTASLAIANTGMAVTVDISDLEDIHPKNKQEVGRRLALWALAKTYGFDNVVYSGPLYKSMAKEGDKIRISFDHIGSGLATSNARPPTWFEIAGAEKQFVEAKAKIENNTVVVWSDEIAEPVAVRFGWHEEAQLNLMNKEGLPASAFRTDRW
ncbi:MAG: sialate O-acetylesterase [Planctomycetota bacterium]|nr:MAG: sialate O-acetylesterase [Planctomycetota bacterium]